MNKSVLISIQPKWCELIANDKKTIEVRKTKPNIPTPFKCYIYCTKGEALAYPHLNKPHFHFMRTNNGTLYGRQMTSKEMEDSDYLYANGKVIGEFVCDAIFPISITYSDPNSRVALKEFPYTGLTDKQIIDYLGNGKKGYGWHISDLVIYNKPKKLSEFFVYCDKCDKKPIACKFAYEESNENGYYSECTVDYERPIERPPQSWCYVEEVQ